MPPQKDTFPSLEQVLNQYLDAFPLEKLMNESVETVHRVLWDELVQQEGRLTTLQFMKIWCDYATEKQLHITDESPFRYFGLDAATCAGLSKEEMITFSLEGMNNGLVDHRQVMKLWRKACEEADETSGGTKQPAIVPENELLCNEELASVSLVPPEQKRVRPRKHPLAKDSDADEPNVTTSPPKKKKGRPRKYPSPEPAQTAKEQVPSPDMSLVPESPAHLAPQRRRGSSPARSHASALSSSRKDPLRLQKAATVVVADEPVSPSSVRNTKGTIPATKMTTRGKAKPHRRFDPCAGDGRYWSEPGRHFQTIPKHVLMKSPTSKKKNGLFNMNNRATSVGKYNAKSLWKYTCPKDGATYILEVANAKGVSKKDGKIDVIYKGYGSKKYRVSASDLQVPTDEDFQKFEANLLHARQLANASIASQRK